VWASGAVDQLGNQRRSEIKRKSPLRGTDLSLGKSLHKFSARSINIAPLAPFLKEVIRAEDSQILGSSIDKQPNQAKPGQTRRSSR
jgi:hypothetical protein